MQVYRQMCKQTQTIGRTDGQMYKETGRGRERERKRERERERERGEDRERGGEDRERGEIWNFCNNLQINKSINERHKKKIQINE